MTKTIASFHVDFELPDGATQEDCVDYIRTALLSECGQYDLDDPMFNFNKSSLYIRPAQRKFYSLEE